MSNNISFIILNFNFFISLLIYNFQSHRIGSGSKNFVTNILKFIVYRISISCTFCIRRIENLGTCIAFSIRSFRICHFLNILTIGITISRKSIREIIFKEYTGITSLASILRILCLCFIRIAVQYILPTQCFYTGLCE